MISETMLSNNTFKQYRSESIRYFGNQQRMQDLLTNLFFQGNKSTLNILVTGGSISANRVLIKFKFNTNN